MKSGDLAAKSCPTLAAPWTVDRGAWQGFSRQEDWSGLPSPSPGDLPDPGDADSLPTEPQGKPRTGER